MYIEAIRIHNYRSIRDSGELKFQRGFNIVVGANNSGKSSLLRCIACQISLEPHRSIRSLPTRDSMPPQTSRVDITVISSGPVVKRLLTSRLNGFLYIPWPANLPYQYDNAGLALEEIFAAPSIPFHATLSASDVGLGWRINEYPATRLHTPLRKANTLAYIGITVDRNAQTVVASSAVESMDSALDVGIPLCSFIAGQSYRFNAERLNVSTSAVGTNSELAPDARNLPEVIHHMQGNSARMDAYCELVREVFPSIERVSTHSLDNNMLEIRVWTFDSKSERDDLAIPLAQCGSGVGQVLAILYVVKTSDQPRTIIIDEPGSFLHPGAARVLIGILKRFSQHQYIVSTHSPEIIAELADCPVTIVRWHDSESHFEQFLRTTPESAKHVLGEIGTKLSDIFGFDRVLWVEGASDVETFKALLEAERIHTKGTAIVPVRNTGSFQTRSIAEILDIYRALSGGGALLPPAVRFLFDRDDRPEAEIQDAHRQSGGEVRFIERRMLECYLIDLRVIAALFNEEGRTHGIATTEDDVREWIERRSTSYLPKSHKSAAAWSQEWYANVDAAKLLGDLFSDLSTAKLRYHKTVHTPKLALHARAIEPSITDRVLALVRDVFA